MAELKDRLRSDLTEAMKSQEKLRTATLRMLLAAIQTEEVSGKAARELTDEEIVWKTDGTRTYQDLTRRCLATMVETAPLEAVEPDRKRIHMPDVVPLTELKKRGGWLSVLFVGEMFTATAMGYFEHVENCPLSAMDRLPQHCFKDTRGWYFDERSRRLPGAVEPVGEWGVDSYRTIDDEISKALGIPLSPEE